MSVKVGVIGVGRIGEHHLRNYSSMHSVQLKGIFDNDASKAAKLAGKYDSQAYATLDALLDDCDAVSICVPTVAHHDTFLKVAARGVHALVEKPISLNVEEAGRMIEAARQNRTIFMVGHVERFNPVILTVREILDPEKIIYIETQRLGPYPTSGTEIGVVNDLMIHDIDVVHSLIDSDVSDVSSRLIKVVSQTEDIANAQIVYANGMTAALTASRVTNFRVRVLNITLKDTYVSADYQTQEVVVRSGLLPEYIGGKHVSYKQVSAMEIPYVQRGEPLRLELTHFVECLAEGKTPDVTGETGKKNLEVALRILQSGL